MALNAFDLTKQCYYLYRRPRRLPVDLLVIHHSWTYDLNSCLRAFKRAGNSSHFAINRQGAIYQLLPLDCYGAHCVGYNKNSVGVDLIRGEGQEILDVQYRALNELIAFCVDNWHWSAAVLNENHVFYHRALRNTSCPGTVDDSKIIVPNKEFT